MNNTRQLFWASFLTLIAAGMGFSIRGGVLAEWGEQFGFTKSQLGEIVGGGLAGFGITIIACSLFIDRIGYKPLMVLAFLLHTASALMTVAATPVYESAGPEATYRLLFWAMFMFSLANGVCEAVINPLVATLYPRQKTHYLNILHAGWPAGLILGGLLAFAFVGRDEARVQYLRWEIPMCFYLVPTLWYGFIVLKEKFPISEAKAAGIDFATMMKEFAAPLMIMLLVLHAMIGYVELGTDSWITNIMGNVIKNSVLLLVYTAGIMFVLRFFAGPIVEKINPVGLLFVTAVLGSIGLYMLGEATTTVAIMTAATIYGVGKTFFWPTMLGVVGERFPKGGALTMGAVGGVGMLSAGLLGGPGIGYTQDYFASEQLKQEAPEVYDRYKSDTEKGFLVFPKIAGLDGKKVGELEDKIKQNEPLTPQQEQDKEPVLSAGLYGGRMALKYTALVPAMMAVGFFILVLYFMAKGGYKVEVLHGQPPDGEHYTGGVEGPVE